ncbi:hypothetical protein SALWKB29_0290 [Snodgrassella communis]|uniref:Uncharacterized protein n=1 Tax=Snodgrassella communis TaxID=2946699 RepID=A0A836MRR9_9NEIS|nr:hypothetical protein SALWKB29_0290 [Snodgrassella communis]
MLIAGNTTTSVCSGVRTVSNKAAIYHTRYRQALQQDGSIAMGFHQ